MRIECTLKIELYADFFLELYTRTSHRSWESAIELLTRIQRRIQTSKTLPNTVPNLALFGDYTFMEGSAPTIRLDELSMRLSFAAGDLLPRLIGQALVDGSSGILRAPESLALPEHIARRAHVVSSVDEDGKW
jgi:hypothetical protein